MGAKHFGGTTIFCPPPLHTYAFYCYEVTILFGCLRLASSNIIGQVVLSTHSLEIYFKSTSECKQSIENPKRTSVSSLTTADSMLSHPALKIIASPAFNTSIDKDAVG